MNPRIKISELAPCGVFCGACPSYGKTCLGCASPDHNQSRKSKWGCKIRNCCYEEKKLVYCIDCGEFPCLKITKKLIDSHPGDVRFTYRHEIPHTFNKLRVMKEIDYLNFQKKRYQCESCGGRVPFYYYRCDMQRFSCADFSTPCWKAHLGFISGSITCQAFYHLNSVLGDFIFCFS